MFRVSVGNYKLNLCFYHDSPHKITIKILLNFICGERALFLINILKHLA